MSVFSQDFYPLPKIQDYLDFYLLIFYNEFRNNNKKIIERYENVF
jgi:hypothetical protein